MEEDSEMRPNIRIEIQNNLMEPMDVDEPKASEGEEGEISDANEIDEVNQDITYLPRPNLANKIFENAEFSVNVIDKEEQEKRIERAKRFALDSVDSTAAVAYFQEDQLNELRHSLGINEDNEMDVRYEAIHMHGTDHMVSEDILEYFGKYAPAGIEWISDSKCNVVWVNSYSAARAIFFTSKPIKGLPIVSSNLIVDEENLEGRSILLRNKDREIVMRKEGIDKENGSEVHVSDITIPIPPGYWRLGQSHDKSECILLRFVLKTDKKPFKAERFNDFKKKFTSINYGMKGIISESRKQKMKGIFDRNHKSADEGDNKNPWGNLAKNWHEDFQFTEPEYREVEVSASKKNSNLQHRLGFKRALIAEEDKPAPPEEVPEKKTKLPRMRMYADEEEEKIKRRRQLQALKTVDIKEEKKLDDLRNVLRLPSRKKPEEIVREHEERNVDLGLKLKNRKIKEAAIIRLEEEKRIRLEQQQIADARMKLHERRLKRSPVRRKEQYSDFEDDYNDNKTGSKVTVVIKKQKAPAVASTVWSRIPNEKDRLKTVSEGKLRVRRDSSSSISTSASSSSSDTSDSEKDNVDADEAAQKKIQRPGFSNDFKFNKSLDYKATENKNPLKLVVKIKNDHFKDE